MVQRTLIASRPSQIALKWVQGRRINSGDRLRLTPALLAILAMGRYIELTEVERYRLPISKLVQLALTGAVTLSRRERDRLNPIELAKLVVAGRVLLEADEFQRLPRSVRELVTACARKTSMSAGNKRQASSVRKSYDRKKASR